MRYRAPKALTISLVVYYLVLICQCHQSFNAEPPKRFTIEFKSPLNDTKAIEEDRERFLAYLQNQNAMQDIRVRYNYSDVINGMSIEVVPPEISATSSKEKKMKTLKFLDYTLSNCPYVTRYWPGKQYSRPKTMAEKINLPNNQPENEDEVEKYFRNSSSIPLIIDGGRPNLKDAHELTTVDKVKKLGWTGKGIKIGIIDTGIDYTHPALGGCFGKGCLVAYGKDLVGDTYGRNSMERKPDDDPLDQCDGHGTHVAGIIAANDKLKGFEGVAIGVTLGAYRVFGCNGDTDDDIIIAAVDMASKAGTDIINISLGGGMSSWEEDPLAVALSNMAKKNITVVVAQGNEGKDGIARTPSPAIGKNLLSVGSVDNKQKYSPVIHDQQSEDQEGIYEYITIKGRPFDINGSPVVLSTNDEISHSACKLLDSNFNITGQVILVKGGGCDIESKARNVYASGGTGLLLYNDINTPLFLNEPLNLRLPIPVATLSYNEGFKLAKSIETHRKKGNTSSPFIIQFITKMVKVNSAGEASGFSTWGPDPELHFKPEILAVGGHIFSTFPVNMGAYATLSGTSMASPYLAGCIALFMEATQIRDSSIILTKLTNYAKPTTITIDGQGEFLQSIVKQGAGLVQIYNSIYGHNFIFPNKITLNDTEHFANNTTLTVINLSEDTKLFEFDFLTAIGVNGYKFLESAVPGIQPAFHVAKANVIFNQTHIQLGTGERAHINVRFEQPVSEIKHLLYGGFLRVTSENDVTHVPFYGSLDNQRELPIFDTKAGYPFIGNNDGKAITDESQLKFNFPEERLNIYTRLGSPTAHIKFEVINSFDNKILGEIQLGSNNYISRNDHSPETLDYVLDWRGHLYPIDTTADKNDVLEATHNQRNSNPTFISSYGSNVLNMKEGTDGNTISIPSGTYRIRASALKIFGNPKIGEDWESWYSPRFQVIG